MADRGGRFDENEDLEKDDLVLDRRYVGQLVVLF